MFVHHTKLLLLGSLAIPLSTGTASAYYGGGNLGPDEWARELSASAEGDRQFQGYLLNSYIVPQWCEYDFSLEEAPTLFGVSDEIEVRVANTGQCNALSKASVFGHQIHRVEIRRPDFADGRAILDIATSAEKLVSDFEENGWSFECRNGRSCTSRLKNDMVVQISSGTGHRTRVTYTPVNFSNDKF